VAVSTNVGCGDWLDASPNEAAPQPAGKVRQGFWTVVATFTVVNMGGTLPIPLYILWQPRFHFDAGVLTLIFAVYVVGTFARQRRSTREAHPDRRMRAARIFPAIRAGLIRQAPRQPLGLPDSSRAAPCSQSSRNRR